MASAPMTVDRAPSFKRKHTFEKLYTRGDGTEVWGCNGSCGQDNCQEKQYFPET